MSAYVVRRLLLLPFLLLAVSFVVFVLVHAVPGDPVDTIVGAKANKEVRDRVRRERGFDKPVLVQYGIYLQRLVRGDLGESFKRSNERVADEILRALPRTVELTLAALLLATLGGLLFGILSAVYKGTWIDFLSMFGALAGVSIPVFWLGLMLILILGGVLPVSGDLDPRLDRDATSGFLIFESLLTGHWQQLGDALLHLILPAMTLATVPLSIIARMTRESMLEVLTADYIRTAHAKGLSIRGILLRHALRNALIPIVTVTGLEFGYLLGGAVLTEHVFSWPGMGSYIVRAVGDTEYDSVTGAILVLSALFVVVNLLVDLLYVLIDPRIRYEPKSA